MKAGFGSIRRNYVLAVCIASALMVLIYATRSFDMVQSRRSHLATMQIENVLGSRLTRQTRIQYTLESIIPRPLPVITESDEAPPSFRMSRLHFLIPASQSNRHLCYNVASAAVNQYPVPTLLGWKGQGNFDAGLTHLAKLRALERYLQSLGDEQDDDLVLIADGYDILHQLPPSVILERYFEVVRKANSELARRLDILPQAVAAGKVRQSVFFGADKVCFPPDSTAARCWAAPASHLEPNTFGTASLNHGFSSADPQWLNSGTLMGPVGDVRRVVNATMAEIDATFDAAEWQSNSDQYHLANVWGRQEYWRLKHRYGPDGEVPGGPDDRVIPAKRTQHQETEFHMAVEYEASLFQLKAGNEQFLSYFQYNVDGNSATVTMDVLDKGKAFVPYNISMPPGVKTALTRLYDSIAETHPGVSAEDWIKRIHLGTNFITKHIYALWHCTGDKEFIDTEYTKMWFYPYVQSLLRASVRASHRGEAILSDPLDQRTWMPQRTYPHKGDLEDEFGGAWSDEAADKFVPWRELCGIHEDLLFWGQQATGMG